MKPALFTLPFISLLFGMIGTAISSAMPELAIASMVGWILAAALIALWVGLDFANFKKFFTRSGSKFGAGSGLVVLLGIGVIVGIGLLTTKPRFNKTFDLTRSGSNTLSDQSVKIINTLNEKKRDVTITAFFQDDEVKDQFRGLVRQYETLGAEFKVEYVSPLADPTRAMAEKLTSGNTVIVRSGDQDARITTFNEEKLTNALVKVQKTKIKKVYFTAGHGEGVIEGKEPDGFDIVVQQLRNDKYDVAALSLIEKIGVPEDADLVVIAGPKYDFTEQEATFLEDYLKKGGAVLAMVDAVRTVKNLNTVLGKFGIEFNSDLVLMSEEDQRSLLFGRQFAVVSDFDDFSPVTKDFANNSQIELLFPFTRTIAEKSDNQYSMKVTMAAKTSEYMEKVDGVLQESDLQAISIDRLMPGAFPVLAVATGKASGPELAAGDAATSGKKETADGVAKPDTAPSEGMAPTDKEIRVVAVGSSHFARNQGAQSAESNRDLFMNISSYLLQDDDFISIRPKDLTKSNITLTSGTSQLMLTFISLIYPFVFLGYGILHWMRRRNA